MVNRKGAVGDFWHDEANTFSFMGTSKNIIAQESVPLRSFVYDATSAEMLGFLEVPS